MKWLALVVLAVSACRRETAAPPPLTVEAYVWQDPSRPEVRESVERAAGIVEVLHFRAAELRWNGHRFEIQRTVRSLPAPGCGLVVRIGASAASLDWTPERINAVAAVFRELAALGPRELQCDYDCPQKRLEVYQKLLRSCQAAAGSVPVRPTTLPSWLGEPAFRPLVAQSGGYVLQVHSLQLPQRAGEPVEIFNVATARTAVNQAAALGVPFRVAMATYGCEVWFDAEGRVSEVISEDTSQEGSPFKRSFALTDPVASAALVREWTARRPTGMQGLIWYRLPVASDRRNWPWPTFERVIRGDAVPSVPVFEATPGPGARDGFIANSGNFPLRLPLQILIRSPLAAADEAGPYRIVPEGSMTCFQLRDDVWPWLDPGKKIPFGWLRMKEETARIVYQLLP